MLEIVIFIVVVVISVLYTNRAKSLKEKNIYKSKSVPEVNDKSIPLEKDSLTEFQRADMKKNKVAKQYSNSQNVSFMKNQVENEIRILNDSLKIIDNTDNINTFFSRWNLVQEKLKILKIAEQQGLAQGITTTASNINQIKEGCFSGILARSSKRVISELKNLKTLKGQMNKLDNYAQLLRQYENEYKNCSYDLYVEMVQSVNDSKKDLEILSSSITESHIIKESNLNPVEDKDQNSVLKPIKTENFQEKFGIPSYVMELLWVKNENGCNCDNLNEPSLIDTSFPINDDFQKEEWYEKIGYYPSYVRLTVKQKAIYLNWLKDVTQPIDIGYVFIFYYGLERHLFYGKHDEAFHMILNLKKYHANSSFQGYSTDSMIIASLLNQRYDAFKDVDLSREHGPVRFLIRGMFDHGFSASDLMDMHRRVGFTNGRYIKNKADIFERELRKLLNDEFGKDFYPITKQDFLEASDKFTLAIANISLPKRTIEASDITSNQKFKENAYKLLYEAHQRVKKINKS